MELWLLRHARARPAASVEKDHDRPLTDTGRETARKLGGWIRASNLEVPTRVRVSPSVRTRETTPAWCSTASRHRNKCSSPPCGRRWRRTSSASCRSTVRPSR
ncbi:MAG: hypothetical protein GVY32_12045 [Gammaproteobacteria bacterium]|nr:hypothetical protein [Gammaproteobacteria bacterium]